ncbi:MAG TPA: Gldg family protein [Gemmatimonadales bacterium]|nr:Gldg family protein [Gemmatimonadales bacterium]
MNAIQIIARREVKALFDLPTAYILLVIFIGLNGFLYFPQTEVERLATLRPMLDVLPWLLMVFVPAVTMRALAEDVRAGTLEVVLAQPITERELLLGKYLGQVVFLWITLALTLAIPLGLWLGARLEVGVLIAQYVGAALLVAGFAAVGVWASSVTRNQITAFILGVAVMFALVIVAYDPILVGLPAQLSAIAAAFGVLAHFQQIARGAVDLRDVIYFLTLAAVFLSLAYFSLMRRKLSPGGAELKRLRLGTTLLVAVLIMLNLFGRWIGGRLDLSPGRQFTLSGASKDLLAHIPDLVTIKLFASSALPPEVAYVKRDVDDLLGDYRASGHGRVRLVVIDPSGDSTAAREAASLGIPPVQFNVMGQSSLQVKEGYLGLAVQYANEVRQIPLIRQTSDLEYRLTAFIRDLTRTSRPAVGWVGVPSNPQQDQGSGYNTLRSSLDRSYTVRDISLTSDSSLGTDLKVLVLSDAPDSIPPAQLEPLRRFLASGGSALVMASGMRHSMQEPFAMARRVPWNALLQPFGVSIQSDIVYDLAANEAVSMPSQYGQVVMAYPLWIRAGSTRASTVNAEVTGVFLPWTSSIDTTHATRGTVTPLLVSSRAAGTLQGQAMLSPQQDFARTNLATRILAVAVSPSTAGAAAPNAPKGRLVVIGNDDFASDRFAQNQGANVVFVENAIDWLAQDDALIAIRSKDRTPPPLVFPNAAVKVAVRYGNLIGIPLCIVLFGATRLMRRRRLTRQAYRPLASGAAA